MALEKVSFLRKKPLKKCAFLVFIGGIIGKTQCQKKGQILMHFCAHCSFLDHFFDKIHTFSLLFFGLIFDLVAFMSSKNVFLRTLRSKAKICRKKSPKNNIEKMCKNVTFLLYWLRAAFFKIPCSKKL